MVGRWSFFLKWSRFRWHVYLSGGRSKSLKIFVQQKSNSTLKELCSPWICRDWMLPWVVVSNRWTRKFICPEISQQKLFCSKTMHRITIHLLNISLNLKEGDEVPPQAFFSVFQPIKRWFFGHHLRMQKKTYMELMDSELDFRIFPGLRFSLVSQKQSQIGSV